jgi:peptide/nickel transport system permease protein
MRLLRDLWRISKSDTPAFIGGVVILIYVVVAIIGPAVVRLPYENNPSNAYLTPSLKYPLGTDFLGNSVLSEVIVGTRPIMEVGIAAAVIVVTVGVIVGLVAGYLGGVVDQIVMRITDVFLTIPGLPLVIVIASIVKTTNPFALAGILSIAGWAGLARAVRSQALSLRTSDFIDAARVQGLPLRNIVGRQLLPNIGPYVAIHYLLAVTDAIYAEVGLYLLGVAPISGTNWGIMINLAMSQGALYTSQSTLYLFSPMLAIVFLQVALVYFSRSMDRLFNPRLRVQ